MKQFIQNLSKGLTIGIGFMMIVGISYLIIKATRSSTNPGSDASPNDLYVSNGETLKASKRNSLVDDANSFGTFESKTLNTAYQAPSDGFVYVYGASNALILYSGATSTPTTRFGEVQADTSNASRYNMMVPIKKGYYWKVYKYAGTGTPVIRWIPFK